MKRLRKKHKDSVQCQRIFQGEGLRDADTVRKGSQNCSKSNIRDYLSLLMFSGRKTTWSLTCRALYLKRKRSNLECLIGKERRMKSQSYLCSWLCLSFLSYQMLLYQLDKSYKTFVLVHPDKCQKDKEHTNGR